MKLTRLAFFSACALAVFGLAGCGGGNDNNDTEVTVNTTGSGSLATVDFGPGAGATFIPRSQTFVARWFAPQTPPSQYTVSLNRYQEARGNAGQSDTRQRITVSPLSTNQWEIRRRDNFQLDGNGVYYLQLTSPGGQVRRAAYIVEETRALPSGKPSRQIDTGGNGSLEGVTIGPGSGDVFIPRETEFIISWPDGRQAPPRLGIDIYRYREPRGEEPRSIEKQNIDLRVIQQARQFGVRVRNNDGNRLAGGGVFYVELTSPGENVRRYAYIVSGN